MSVRFFVHELEATSVPRRGGLIPSDNALVRIHAGVHSVTTKVTEFPSMPSSFFGEDYSEDLVHGQVCFWNQSYC